MERNEELFAEAQRYIPGGVNSPVRAFRQVGGTPLFMSSAKGAYLYGEDGRKYIDYINSWGPMILGHRHPHVTKAVLQQVEKGFSYGTPTEAETLIAKLITTMVPSVDMVRMVNSGTEACMSAVRLARGFTGRSKILKFEGHYHGHADMFLKKAGSGMATLGIKVAGGVPVAVTDDTLVAGFNNSEEVLGIFSQYGSQMAAVIVEPVAGNMGCVPPQPGFLEMLREQCTRHGAVLIFDEVMTGFRLAKGGAQEVYGITADLVTFGKIIGGGMPVGAFAGKRDIMSLVAPLGDVYQAGTLSGNPVAMAAGYATLQYLNDTENIYASLEKKGQRLAEGMREISRKKNAPLVVNQKGSMISIHFTDGEVKDFNDAKRGDNDTFKKFFHYMLEAGIYLPPSPYESWFVSVALPENDIQYTLEMTEKFFGK
ncbi:MAG TPA: glutamate-1-semialdehyde 2,1-aminomutase [Cyclobacteriaceae bacterium]|nr:glutamate-1-semialdehyde 2,1-aminomutase [Cyclobacteriaceae bacterium]